MKQTLLKRLWLAFLAAMLCLPMSAQVEELIHKKISIAYDAATEIIPGEWYIMQNCGQGKSGYQHSNGVGKPITYGKLWTSRTTCWQMRWQPHFSALSRPRKKELSTSRPDWETTSE